MRERPAPRGGTVVPFARPREGAARRPRPLFDAEPLSPAEARERAEAAADVRAGLLHCARRADDAGLPMLGYLIACAALEAAKEGEAAGAYAFIGEPYAFTDEPADDAGER
jgi:hypothetical protein